MSAISGNSQSRSLILLFILLAAFMIRLFYLLSYSSLPDWTFLTVDNNYHHHWAQSMMNNFIGDTTYFRAPFYVVCLALIYKLFSASLWVARLFGMVVGLATVYMTWRLGRRIFNEKVAAVGALLYALLPMAIYFEGELLLDSLFTLLLLCSIYLAVRWNDSGQLSTGITAGFIMGLAIITRPTALVLVPVILLYYMWNHRPANPVTKNIMYYLFGTGIVVALVFARNLIVAGDPVLLASQGGINFYIGNNEQADGVTARLPEPLGNNWRIKDITYQAEQNLTGISTGRQLHPGEVSSYWTARAVNWIVSNPDDFLALYIRKLSLFFSNEELSNNRNLAGFFRKIPILNYNPLSFGIIFILAVLGIMTGYRDHRHLRLILFTMAAYIAIVALFFITSRFRLPLMPYLALLGALGLLSIRQTVLRRPRLLWSVVPAVLIAGWLSYFPIARSDRWIGPTADISLGLQLFSSGDYTGALGHFKLARRADSTWPEVNLNCGAAFIKMGEIDSAKIYLEQEKLFNPGRHRTYSNLASVYLISDSLDLAIRAAKKAIDLRPYDITANMIYLRIVARDSTVGIDSFTTVANLCITRGSQDIYLMLDAAALLSERGNNSASRKILSRAFVSTPPPIETDDAAFDHVFRNSRTAYDGKRAEAAYQLGYLSGLRGKFAEAIEFSQAAILLDSTLLPAWVNLISGYISIGDHARADSIYEQAISRFPDHPYLQQLRRRE